MTTQCYSQVRGSVLRVTKLDSCGHPDSGQSAVVVSKRVSTVTVGEVTDTGTNIRERNFGDELLIVDDSYDRVVGYTADIAFCGVDPAIIALMTGQNVATNAQGDIVGFDANTGIDLSTFAYSLEVWSKIAGAACDAAGRRKWGYTVFPFLKGGRIGGFTFSNGVVQFTVSGSQSRDGNAWGTGPFDVDRNAAGAPAVLNAPLGVNTHFRNTLVTLDPPAAACGAFPILSGSF